MKTHSALPRRFGVAVLAVSALVLAACAEDGPDAHLAGGTDETEESTESGEGAEESGEGGEGSTESGEGETTDGTGESDETEESDSADGSEETDGADETAPAETVAPTGEVVTVLSLDNTFIEEVVEVAAGTEVLWTNNGRNEHNVIPVDPSQDWGVEVEEFAPGDEYSHVFGAPGEYAYFCTIHGTETVGMIGTVIVTE